MTLIDIRKKVTNDYQLDFYSVPSTNNTTTTEFKYKNFKITYERSFLPLDMNNWLGEIGGVGSILYFIHLAAIKIAMSFLLKNARYSDSLYAKAANEAFDQFN